MNSKTYENGQESLMDVKHWWKVKEDEERWQFGWSILHEASQLRAVLPQYAALKSEFQLGDNSSFDLVTIL